MSSESLLAAATEGYSHRDLGRHRRCSSHGLSSSPANWSMVSTSATVLNLAGVAEVQALHPAQRALQDDRGGTATPSLHAHVPECSPTDQGATRAQAAPGGENVLDPASHVQCPTFIA